MSSYRWMYDADPQVALTLRSDFRRRHKEARLAPGYGLSAEGIAATHASSVISVGSARGRGTHPHPLWPASVSSRAGACGSVAYL
jgi:hypothetical protein